MQYLVRHRHLTGAASRLFQGSSYLCDLAVSLVVEQHEECLIVDDPHKR